MSEVSFGDAEYVGKRTRREVFLAEMEQVVPWKSLLLLIDPLYEVARFHESDSSEAAKTNSMVVTALRASGLFRLSLTIFIGFWA